MTVTHKRFRSGLTTEMHGDGPLFVSVGRDAHGHLVGIEIVTGDEALFRADKPAREIDLHIARQMVRAFNNRHAEFSALVSALAEVAA